MRLRGATIRLPILTAAMLAVGIGTIIGVQPLRAEQENDATAQAKTALPVVRVWKSPTCGCCGKWIDHMKAAGFTVKAQDMDDISMVKRLAGVPDAMASCHTAVVKGYVIEGHVPAKDVKRLLKERPKGITGLSVPGMVSGSPGMENGRVEPYDVISFGDNGTQVFSSYR